MLLEGLRERTSPPEEDRGACLTPGLLLAQGVATSIDALSVGFTIEKYTFIPALTAALLIAAVTFVICFTGLIIGKRFGTLLKNKAVIFGGIILIAIGIEIFVKGVLV